VGIERSLVAGDSDPSVLGFEPEAEVGVRR
jgi:hypothetical protein